MGPLTVNHYGQVPAVTISFNLKPGVALGDAVDAVRKVASSMLPPHHQYELSGGCASLRIIDARSGTAVVNGHFGHLYCAGDSL